MELADVVTVYSEKTPNPESMKFVANRMILPNDSIDFRIKENLDTCPMAEELFQYDFVSGVFIMNNFVSVTKKEDYEWFDIIPQLKKFVHGKLICGISKDLPLTRTTSIIIQRRSTKDR